MFQRAVADTVEIAGRPGFADEIAHQDEQRNHRKQMAAD